jgi:hypothetical protein
MKKKIILLLFSSPIIFALNGCGAKTDTEKNIQTESQNNKEKITDQESSQPTRVQMLNDLNLLYRKMSNRKFEEVKKLIKFRSSSVSQEEIETEISRSIENKEIFFLKKQTSG